MQSNIEQLFTELNTKVKKQKSRLTRLETENEALRKSVFKYLEQMEDQKKEMEENSQRAKNHEISDAILTDKKKMQKEIDKYILMIDKCIAALQVKM